MFGKFGLRFVFLFLILEHYFMATFALTHRTRLGMGRKRTELHSLINFSMPPPPPPQIYENGRSYDDEQLRKR